MGLMVGQVDGRALRWQQFEEIGGDDEVGGSVADVGKIGGQYSNFTEGSWHTQNSRVPP